MISLSPTLSLEDAARVQWDVVVVGAGCAGSVASRQIARSGARVLLVDKSSFPRWKVCGCCISVPTQEALDAIGLSDLLARCGAVPASTFRVASCGVSANVRLPGYQLLSRERLDAELVTEAMKAGAAFLPKTQAGLSGVSDVARSVVLRSNNQEVEVSARIVLAADGLGGRLLRTTDEFDSKPLNGSRIGAGAISSLAPDYYSPGVIYMACATGGYVGAGRLEDGRLVLAATYDADYVRECGGLAEAAVRVLDEAGFADIDDIRSIPWRGTPALTRRASRVSAHRAFVLGDAAGYVEPFTGEGMKWAICSGVALAPVVVNAIRQYDAQYEREWETRYRQIVSNRQAVCRLLAAGLRRPRLVRASVRAVAAIPIVAVPFVWQLNAPLECLKEFMTL